MLLTSTFSENVLRWNPQKTLNSSFQQTLLEFLFIGTKFEQENMIRVKNHVNLFKYSKAGGEYLRMWLSYALKSHFPPFTTRIVKKIVRPCLPLKESRMHKLRLQHSSSPSWVVREPLFRVGGRKTENVGERAEGADGGGELTFPLRSGKKQDSKEETRKGGPGWLTFPAARLKNGVVVAEVFDVGQTDSIVFRFGAGFFIRFLVLVHLDLATSQRFLPVETFAKGSAVPERHLVGWRRTPERHHFLQIHHVNGNVVQIVRDTDLWAQHEWKLQPTIFLKKLSSSKWNRSAKNRFEATQCKVVVQLGILKI